MSTLYFFNNTDNLWDTVDNWYTDASGAIPASRMPVNGDNVVIATTIQFGPSVNVTLNAIDVAPGSTGGGSFYATIVSPSYPSVQGAIGPTYFHSSSVNAGTPPGNAVRFLDSSSNADYLGDYVMFKDFSINSGTVADYAEFDDQSSNVGTVGDHATFNSLPSYPNGANMGGVGHNATFIYSSRNGMDGGAAGVVGNYASFLSNSRNEGIVGNHAYFNSAWNDSSNGPGYGSGIVGTYATFDSSTNWGVVGWHATFNGSGSGGAYDGSVGRYATFNDSYNGGSAGDYAIFNGSSYTEYGWASPSTVGDYATFNDSSIHRNGSVANHATFNGTSSVQALATVGDYATFNDGSNMGQDQSGSSVGNHATFNGNSILWSQAGDYVTFNDYSHTSAYGFSLGSYFTVNDNAIVYYAPTGDYGTMNGSSHYRSSGSYMTFNDYSYCLYNGFSVVGEGGVGYVFNGHSLAGDYAIITGPVTFNDWSGITVGCSVNGDAWFNDASYPESLDIITGTKYFRSTGYIGIPPVAKVAQGVSYGMAGGTKSVGAMPGGINGPGMFGMM